MEEKKVIVIGGGPAGLSAAVYLARARLAPLVLAGEKAGGQLMYTTLVENYPGFKEGIQGPELMEAMRRQAERFGAEIKNENVVELNLKSEIKKVRTSENEYEAQVLVITSGAKAKMLEVGEEKLLGRGVSTCATCDAAFFKNKAVFVVGGGDVAMEDALALVKFTDQVTVIHRRDEFRASKAMQEKVLNNSKIEVWWNTEVVGVEGQQKLEKIKVKNNQTGEEKMVVADGLFISVGHIPETDYLKGTGLEIDERGYLKTDLVKKGFSEYPTQTNIEGVFGAGDVVDFKYKQAVTAAGMGVMASLDAEKYLT